MPDSETAPTAGAAQEQQWRLRHVLTYFDELDGIVTTDERADARTRSSAEMIAL